MNRSSIHKRHRKETVTKRRKTRVSALQFSIFGNKVACSFREKNQKVGKGKGRRKMRKKHPQLGIDRRGKIGIVGGKKGKII